MNRRTSVFEDTNCLVKAVFDFITRGFIEIKSVVVVDQRKTWVSFFYFFYASIGITAGTLVNALAQQVSQSVVDVGRMALIIHGRCQTVNQSSLAIHATEQ